MTFVTETRRRRVGLLGGTFDPPHIGHLAAAVSAGDHLALDEVRLVPNGDPWQKRGTRVVSPAPVRLAMVAAAVAGLPGVEVSDLEVRRPGASYTVDTVDRVRADEPDVDVVLVLGRDAAEGLATWERHEDLLALVELAVVDRSGPGEGGGEVAPGITPRWVPMDRLDVSSTEMRRRVAEGRRVDVLVPAAVVALIAAEGLYRTDS